MVAQSLKSGSPESPFGAEPGTCEAAASYSNPLPPTDSSLSGSNLTVLGEETASSINRASRDGRTQDIAPMNESQEKVATCPPGVEGSTQPRVSNLEHTPAGTTSEQSDSAAEAGVDRPSIAQRTNSWLTKFGPISRVMSIASSRDLLTPLGYTSEESRPWRTTFLRFGPLTGILGMLIAISSIIASLGILAGSNNQPVANWSAPPSTYLAIFTAVANLSMRYAAFQGVIVAWWFRASRGSTLSKLHWDWRAGTTIFGALTAGPNMGLLGLACIFSTVVVIDGPLLQRSSTVRLADYLYPTPLNVTMAPEIPKDFTGWWWDSSTSGVHFVHMLPFNSSVPTPYGHASNYIQTFGTNDLSTALVDQWYDQSALNGVVQGCSGDCKVKIKAPALFAQDCSSHVQTVDYFMSFDVGSYVTAPPWKAETFIVGISLVFHEGHERVNLISGYSTSTGGARTCAGIFNYTICSLIPGIGEYNVTVHNDVLTLDVPVQPSFVAFANNTARNDTLVDEPGGYPSTLAGIVENAYDRYGGSVYQYTTTGNKTAGVTVGLALFYKYLKSNIKEQDCWAFHDPYETVLEGTNELMFYAGAFAAKQDPPDIQSRMDLDLSIETLVTGDSFGTHPVFHTDYWFFLAAAVTELVCIALVLPTYWGWWKLGRSMSFSPLETAKAFESPMFAKCNSNSSGRDIARTAGDKMVKYGSLASDDKSPAIATKLAFADPSLVSEPQKGSRFTT